MDEVRGQCAWLSERQQLREIGVTVSTPVFKTLSLCSDRFTFCHHDVVHLSARDPRSHRRPSTPSTCRTQRVLPRIQIMGSPDAKTPFRLHRVLPPTPTHPTPQLTTYALSSFAAPNHHTRGCGYRQPGSYLSPCREFVRERPWVGR